VVFPSFSHSSHAAANRDDPRPGWWQNMVGPGLAINTSNFRVICASVLGSPFGTTSPLSIDPMTGKTSSQYVIRILIIVIFNWLLLVV
jgi:homoserine O-acetyltransferase